MRSAGSSKIASTNGVSDHLKALEKKGYIHRVGKRAIEVVNALRKSVLSATREIPVLGRVPAGKGEENIDGMITIPDDIGSGERFALLVKGDSMIDVGIMDGDRVIMKQQETAENGEIVCALINDAEALLQERRRGYAQSGKQKVRPDRRLGRRIPDRRADRRAAQKILGWFQ